MDIVEKYISAGLDRVILGTAAAENRDFVLEAVSHYKEKIAVGVDIRDGFVAIKGWTQKSSVTADDFFRDMEEIGVSNVICTDISKDGAMQGTNRELYKRLSREYDMDITASGGVSSLEDVRALAAMGLYGAVIGKAYYTGAIDLASAITEAK